MLCRLKDVSNGESLGSLVEVPDGLAGDLEKVIDERLTMGKLQNGTRFTLVPLQHEPLQGALLEILALLEKMDKPNRSLQTLQALQDGVVHFAGSLFKTFKVYPVKDVVEDLQVLVNYYSGKLPGHELPLESRSRLAGILPPECSKWEEEE